MSIARELKQLVFRLFILHVYNICHDSDFSDKNQNSKANLITNNSLSKEYTCSFKTQQ